MRSVLFLLMALASPAWAATRGEQLMLAGRLEEALDVVRDEAVAAPRDVDAQERYIDLLLTLRLPHEATQMYRARVAANPQDADAHYLLGRAATTIAEARAGYEAALRLNPSHARSHMGMGALYRAVQDPAAAETAYRRATELDPKLAEAWAGLGYALLSQGRGEEALAAARQGIAHCPEQADAYLAVAVLAPGESQQILEEAARRIPHDPRTHAALAELYLVRGDGDNAKKAAQRAIAIDPGDSDALLSAMFADAMSRGVLDPAGYQALVQHQRVERTDPDVAARAYDDLVKRYPKCALVYMSRARLLAARGDTKGAVRDLEKALAIEPGNVEAQAAYGLVLYNEQRAAEARPWLEKAAKARPRDASLAMAAAMAERDSGDVPAAKLRLSAASQTWPYDARVAMTRARVLSDAGDREGAYAVLRDAVGRIPDARLVLALAAAAKDIGRFSEAATLLEELGKATGNASFRDIAADLRSHAPNR